MLAVQCKMARAALGLGVRELAERAKVSPDTIARLERGEELKERTLDAIRASLEAAGVEFVGNDSFGGPGVRLTTWYFDAMEPLVKHGLITPRTEYSSQKFVRLVSSDRRHRIIIDVDGLAIDETMGAHYTVAQRIAIVDYNMDKITTVILDKYRKKEYTPDKIDGSTCLHISVGKLELAHSQLVEPWMPLFDPNFSD